MFTQKSNFWSILVQFWSDFGPIVVRFWTDFGPISVQIGPWRFIFFTGGTIGLSTRNLKNDLAIK